MRIVLLFGILFLLAACKPSSQTADENSTSAEAGRKTLEEQLMALHDEAMPKLNEINQLTSQLNQIRKNINETTEGIKKYPDGLNEMTEALKLADQAMWDWMKAYSDARPTVAEDQLNDFFTQEMEKMKKLSADINTSIDTAKTWLAQHGATPSK